MKQEPLFKESRPQRFKSAYNKAMKELTVKLFVVGRKAHFGGWTAPKNRVHDLARRMARAEMREQSRRRMNDVNQQSVPDPQRKL